jgi:uncharacterized lipoprotein YmbA
MRPALAIAALLSFSVLLLAGCASSPPVRYFSLDAPAPAGSAAAQGKILGVGPLPTPEYLQRPQLVTRGPGQQMRVDEYSRWIEPLEQELLRYLSLSLANGLPGTTVVQFPYNSIVRADYRLIGRIDRFDADAEGLAVLTVQWGVGDGKGATLVRSQRTSYSAQATRPGDAGSIVAAMNRTLAEFTADILAELNAAGVR